MVLVKVKFRGINKKLNKSSFRCTRLVEFGNFIILLI